MAGTREGPCPHGASGSRHKGRSFGQQLSRLTRAGSGPGLTNGKTAMGGETLTWHELNGHADKPDVSERADGNAGDEEDDAPSSGSPCGHYDGVPRVGAQGDEVDEQNGRDATDRAAEPGGDVSASVVDQEGPEPVLAPAGDAPGPPSVGDGAEV